MITNLSTNEIQNIGGGICRKTTLSTAASILSGTGAALAAFGQVLHATTPDLSKPDIKWGVQAYVGLAIGIGGFLLNAASAALSTYSSSIPTCVNEVTSG